MLYEIQPFKRDDVIEYLIKFKDKFNTREEAETFYDDLTDLKKDFISIPVFLYILVSTYRKDRPLAISSPGELFKEYEDFLCGPRELLRPGIDEVYRRRLIPFLAFNMCKENEKGITWIKFNEYIQRYNKETYSSIDQGKVEDALTNRFKLMRKGENGDLEFIHQTLRDYFAGVYMKNTGFSPEDTLKLVYTDSTRNNNLVNAARLLVGIVRPEIAKDVIHQFIEKDLYLACEVFAWSSIATYEKEFIDLMCKKIDISSSEYLLSLNEVISFLLKVLDLLQKAEKIKEPISADYMQSLGNAYAGKSDYDRAIEYYKKAILICEKNNMQTYPNYAACLMNLGIAYMCKPDYDRAIECCKKAIEIYEKNGMQQHPDYAKCLNNLGVAYRDIGKKDEAIQSLELALSVFEQSVGKAHPYYKDCQKTLNEIRELGKGFG